MEMFNARLVPLLSKLTLMQIHGKKLLFSLIFIPCLCLSSPSQGEEFLDKTQGFNKFYPSYSVNTLLEQTQASSEKPSTVNWLLDNSVVENGVYSLKFKPSKKVNYGGQKKGNRGVWENLSLKFSLDLIPKQYYHTSLPWLYANDLFDKDTTTHFRVNRSRVLFSISGEWY